MREERPENELRACGGSRETGSLRTGMSGRESALRNKSRSHRMLLESLPGILGIKALKTTRCLWRAFRGKRRQVLHPHCPQLSSASAPDRAFDQPALPPLPTRYGQYLGNGEERAETQIWRHFLPHMGFQRISRQQKQDEATITSHQKSHTGRGCRDREGFL